MARGFGATDGGSTSDLITTTYTGDAQVMSWAFWGYKNSVGATAGHAVNQIDGKSLVALAAPARMSFGAWGWSTNAGRWSCTVSDGAWFHLVVTYDHGSTSNDPVMYLNGSSVAVTEFSTPSGSYTAPGDAYTCGNRPALDRCWDGRLAEVGIWSGVALSANQAAALAAGASPRHYPVSLVCYVPMVRTVVDWRNAVPTVSGTAVQTHPPKVFYPASRRVWAVPAAAPPATTDALLGHLALLGVGR